MPHSDPAKTPIQNRIEDAAGSALEELAVSYTVKELLAQISESVVKIDTKLDAKASVEHVNAVEAACEKRGEKHDERISMLEQYRSKLLGAMAVIGFIAGGGGVGLAQLLAG